MNTMARSSKDILYGLVISLVFLIICVLIKPSGLSANDGISYYGVFLVTIGPYIVSLIASAVFFWLAADHLDSHIKLGDYISSSLRIMAILTVSLILTPHTKFEDLHTTIGSTLFALQIIISGMIALHVYPSWKSYSLVLVELVSGLAALFYLPTANGLLIQSQVVYQIAFSTLLIITFNQKKEGDKPLQKNS
jgi:hypothetical protein